MKGKMKVSTKWQRVVALGAVFAAVSCTAMAADQFLKPTKEELEMKELPGYPGVPAVVLFREEIVKDDMHVVQHYDRIKILTEKGKDEANIELGVVSSRGGSIFDESDNMTVGDIVGRTIHADGTIIPFTGKPYLKTIRKTDTYTYQAKVFTLPDVEVGSIIEYRYAHRYNDHFYESPTWFIQGELFLKSAHYMWYPTSHDMQNSEGTMITHISSFPILPPGVEMKNRWQPGGGANGASQQIYEVTVKDVPPSPHAEFMPPVASFNYLVRFNFTPYATQQEYWTAEGKRWSKSIDSFIGPNGDLKTATQSIVAGATTPSEKLHKIYAAVMAMENTDYTRNRDQREDKAAGLTKTNSTSDILKHERGDSEQLTYLFIGMARAAGFKAYAMLVPDRAHTIFVPYWLNVHNQFSNTIAIVNVDGKDEFFGPGERYLPYGKLQWNYTYVAGLRQVDGGGTAIAQTPSVVYKDNAIGRVANLKMTEEGQITGTIKMTYTGAPALEWRQRSLRGDEESLRHGLRSSVESLLPKTLDVKLSSITYLKEYDRPLEVVFDVTGRIGTHTGKRLVIPVDLFTVNDHATFPQEKRDMAVYFHYPQVDQDALRINFPATMQLEGVPADHKDAMTGLSQFTRTAESGPTFVTVRRMYAFGGILVPKEEYPALRKYYSSFEAKDQESIVLKMATPSNASVATPAAPGN